MRFTHDSLCPLANVSQDGHGLSLVAANCPGDGKKPKRYDRLTRLAGSYNSEQCKAAILAEDLSRWLQNNANKSEFRGVEVIAVSTRPDHCSVAYVRNLKAGSDAIIKRHHDLLPDDTAATKGGSSSIVVAVDKIVTSTGSRSAGRWSEIPCGEH